MQPKGEAPIEHKRASALTMPDPSPEADDNLKERYLAMLSHDLRSAIGNVISGLDLMDTDGMDAESQLHRTGAMSAARHVTHLIDGILDIRAIGENNFYLELERVDLGEFLDEIYRTWLGPVTAKDLSLKITKSKRLPKAAELDRGRVLRVLGNLMDNAVKYTDEGGIVLSVDFGADSVLFFTVHDNGPGFSEAAKDRLFEFRSRPDDSHKPGTGLGLYIAKSLVENMGGTIDARNRTDGAEIKAGFPLVNVQHQDVSDLKDAEGSVAVLPSAVLPDLSQLNLLLAEDNSTNRIVVTQMLAAMGAKFEVACDGQEAIEKFEQNTFNLALLDIEMPRLSGLDVIKHIRTTKDERMNIPIVVLTAYAMREHREKIFEAGADGMIAKPILGIENFGHELLQHFNRLTENPEPSTPDNPGQASSDGVVDLATFEKLESTIGPEKFDTLLEKVESDLQSVRQKINYGMKGADMQLVASASHVLISVSGAIGASSVQNAGQLLNRAAHLNDKFQITQRVSESLTGIDEILSFIADRRKS